MLQKLSFCLQDLQPIIYCCTGFSQKTLQQCPLKYSLSSMAHNQECNQMKRKSTCKRKVSTEQQKLFPCHYVLLNTQHSIYLHSICTVLGMISKAQGDLKDLERHGQITCKHDLHMVSWNLLSAVSSWHQLISHVMRGAIIQCRPTISQAPTGYMILRATL